MIFDVNTWKIAPEVKERMDAIRYGFQPDTHNWLLPL
jgi:hypothetical protein